MFINTKQKLNQLINILCETGWRRVEITTKTNAKSDRKKRKENSYFSNDIIVEVVVGGLCIFQRSY